MDLPLPPRDDAFPAKVRFNAEDPVSPKNPTENLGAPRRSLSQGFIQRVQSGTLLTKKETQSVKDVFRKPRKYLALGLFALMLARALSLWRNEHRMLDELMVAFDKGNDGQLSSVEMSSMLRSNGVNITAEQFQNIFGLVDDEGDGYDGEETTAILDMLSPLARTSSRIREVAADHRSSHVDMLLTLLVGCFLLYVVAQSDTLEKKFAASTFRSAVHFTKMKSKCNNLDSKLQQLTSDRQQLENSINRLHESKVTDSEEQKQELRRLEARLEDVNAQQESAKKDLEEQVEKWQAEAQKCMLEADRAKGKVQGIMTCMKGIDSVSAFSNAGKGNFVSDGAHLGFCSSRGFSLDKITFGTIENNELCMYESSTADKIGEGRDCAYLSRCLSSGKKFALKMYAINSREQRAAIQNDLCAYKSKVGSHPHIVSYEKVIESETTIFVLMELIAGSDLFDVIANRGFAEREARPLFRQLVEAVRHLHSMGVIHSDLKPENAMVEGEVGQDNAQLKLIDFGCSCFTEHQEVEGRVVHDMYMPPEFFQNRTLRPSVPTDMWRLGCLLFVMLCRRPPYSQDQDTAQGAAQRKMMKFYKDDVYRSLSESARNLIEGLIQGDPERRLTTDQVLANEWVCTGN